MSRPTRALGAFVAAVLVAGGLTVAATPPAQARPAEAGLLDLPLPTPDQLPQLSGVPVVGQVLSVTQPVWNVLPGLVSTDVTWLCNGTPIPGTEGLWSFVPTEAQAGCLVTARTVTTVAGFLPLELVTNALQIPGVIGETAVTPAAAPTVTSGSGGPKVGSALTTSAPEWNQEGVTTTYQWLRNGQPIAGQTSQAYTLVAADLDQPISVRATGRKDGLTEGVVTSNAVTAVLGDAPTPTTQPTISGTGVVGKALSVSPGTWGSGATPTYAFQWRRDNLAIAGATAATYTPTTDDIGRILTVTVTATRAGHRPGTFRTAGVSVPKLVSTLTASVARKTVKQGQRASMTLVLTVTGLAAPTGKVVVLDGKKVVRTVTLAADRTGRITVQLPKLAQGTHRLTATYAGSDLATDAVSKVVKLTVTKVKKKK